MSPSAINSERISLGDITPNNIGQLHKLNAVLFPVTYNENIYASALAGGELVKFVYYNDICVGNIWCRREEVDNKVRLYIVTLGVLKPYRRLGLGSKLLSHILDYAAKHVEYSSIYLHAQVNNEAAVEFYKKHGFEVVEVQKNYYEKLDPKDAYVLRKENPSAARSSS
ncbi:N-alpha-acetyltransferase 50, NatE catalytic subunit [Dichotomocladium elegans]|nr:N-alpha-acetyltransferase 50, NatE catalytic subunit [Dichotomocladium elegans]